MSDQFIEVVNLAQKVGQFSDHWNPKIAGDLDDSHIKLVKVQGEFVWHHHEQADELFLVVQGALTIKVRARDLHLSEGEFAVIPRGIEHLPIAEEEAHILLLEPRSTLNTGDVQNERTVTDPDRI